MGTADWRERQDLLNALPWPGPGPLDRIRHTVAMYQMGDGKADSDVVLDATYGYYPADATLDGQEFGTTGFTFGDLVALLAMVDRR